MLLRRFYVQENTKGKNSKPDEPGSITDMHGSPGAAQQRHKRAEDRNPASRAA